MQADDNHIPFFDLSRQGTAYVTKWIGEIEPIIRSGKFLAGPKVPEFESSFGSWLRSQHVIGCASGSDALELVLRAWEIGLGDEVIVQANTWVSDAEAVLLTGATPVFIDVDENSGQLNPAELESLISEKTKVIIAVHMYGSCCEIDPILNIARQRGIFVLEDCAHSIGLQTDNGMAGTLADAAVFSFYPTKNLGAFGDAGCVATSDPELAERVRLIRDHGQPNKDTHLMVGKTSRMDELQAAILIRKLDFINELNQRRHQIATSLASAIQKNPFLDMGFELSENSVVHLFILQTNSRDEFIRYMAGRGIGTAIHYPLPIPLTPAFQAGKYRGNWKISERRAASIVSLPVFPELTDEEIERIIAAIAEYQG